MRFENKTVPLSSIDIVDHTFRITTNTHVDDLTESLRTVGLVNLPMLIKKGSRLVVISGFRRIQAGSSLGWKSINARIADPGTTRLKCVQYAITDNAFQRALNLIETSRALHLIHGCLPVDEHLTKSTAAFGLPGNLAVIKKILTLHHLPQPVQEYICSGTISLPMALELEKLQPDEGIAVAELFHTLGLSLNKQREVLSMIKEIAVREEKSVSEILTENGFLQILSDQDLNQNQKTQKIRGYLKRRRFPSLVNAEEAFEKLNKALPLDENIRLIPPANFEGKEYTIHLRFDSIEELNMRQKVLSKIAEHDEFLKFMV